jgi:sugar phosphate isomerase/epimerase
MGHIIYGDVTMRLGVCGGPDRAAVAAEAGFEYLEWSVGALLCPRDERARFEQALAEARAAALPCEALNCFLPGDLKVTGPDAEPAAQEAYVSVTMQRAEEAGVRVIVFGSGGARRIPEGFDRERAHAQLLDFSRMAATHANNHGVTLVFEPLNVNECNVLTTVAECAALAREVDLPAMRVLVDGYHWLKDKDTVAGIVDAGPLLAHTHIATETHRRAPGEEACDFSAFFGALRTAGYDRRMSVEARVEDPAGELPRAHAYLAAQLSGNC